MIAVTEVIHVMLAIALIGIVLIQKSEGGGLGIGGGGGMSGFMTGRGQANLLTRTTAILIGGLMLSSIVLAVLHGQTGRSAKSILEQMPVGTESPAAPVTPATPKVPTAPAPPSVPLAK
jgi:preprotein translocase subunit SecG